MNRETLPDSGNVLTFGILSIALTLFCCGPFGGIFGIIALLKAKKATQTFNADPDRFIGFENVKTGKLLSYIGLAFAVIYLIGVIVYFGFIAAFIMAEGNF